MKIRSNVTSFMEDENSSIDFDDKSNSLSNIVDSELISYSNELKSVENQLEEEINDISASIIECFDNSQDFYTLACILNRLIEFIEENEQALSKILKSSGICVVLINLLDRINTECQKPSSKEIIQVISLILFSIIKLIQISNDAIDILVENSGLDIFLSMVLYPVHMIQNKVYFIISKCHTTPLGIRECISKNALKNVLNHFFSMVTEPNHDETTFNKLIMLSIALDSASENIDLIEKETVAEICNIYLETFKRYPDSFIPFLEKLVNNIVRSLGDDGIQLLIDAEIIQLVYNLLDNTENIDTICYIFKIIAVAISADIFNVSIKKELELIIDQSKIIMIFLESDINAKYFSDLLCCINNLLSFQTTESFLEICDMKFMEKLEECIRFYDCQYYIKLQIAKLVFDLLMMANADQLELFFISTMMIDVLDVIYSDDSDLITCALSATLRLFELSQSNTIRTNENFLNFENNFMDSLSQIQEIPNDKIQILCQSFSEYNLECT